MDGMAWIPGATFLMGSDRHYPEEAPVHKATVRLAARRLRAMISPAMHGARRPVKRDRGVQPAVIPTY
jgi:hypothetical protein